MTTIQRPSQSVRHRAQPQVHDDTKAKETGAAVGASAGASVGGAVAQKPQEAAQQVNAPASAATVAGARRSFLQQGAGLQAQLAAKLPQPKESSPLTSGRSVMGYNTIEIGDNTRPPEEPRNVPAPQTAPTNPSTVQAPASPTETTTERTRRLGGEALDPASLQPGESTKVTLGGGASVGAGLAVKTDSTSSMEVKRNQDGTYTVAVDGKQANGLVLSSGTKIGKAGVDVGGDGALAGQTRVEYTAKTPEEAKRIVDLMTRKAAVDAAKNQLPGGSMLPEPFTPGDRDFLNKHTSAVETSSGVGGGFTGKVGQADPSQPVQVGAGGESRGTDMATTRTEYQLDDAGNLYISKVIEKRTQQAEMSGGAGISGKTEGAETTNGMRVGGRKSSTRELEITTEYPRPGTDGEPKTTAVLREEQTRTSEAGRNQSTLSIKKEQEIDMTKVDKNDLLRTMVQWDQEKMKTLPATSSKVTLTTSETASNDSIGPYNAATRKTEVSYNVDPARQGELFSDHDALGDTSRVKGLADPNSEAQVTRTETSTEGVGTGGRLGLSIANTGGEVEADIQRNKDTVTTENRRTGEAIAIV